MSTSHKSVINVKSPMVGKAILLREVPDMIFSSGMLGPGVAFEPSSGILYSPVKGTVSYIAPYRHIINVVAEEGVELMLHIGIDTDILKGRGFKCIVHEGDEVDCGDALIRFNMNIAENNEVSFITSMIVINMKLVDSVESITGKVDKNTTVMTIKLGSVLSKC